MKVLKWIGYAIVTILVLATILFGSLYFRYSSESPAIHNTVEAFIGETRTGTSESLQPYVHPDFFEQLIGLLETNGGLFARIVKVEEDPWYFSYSIRSGVGETTEYHGKVTWDTGETGSYLLKLVKVDGSWVVYGAYIQPDTE